MGSGRKGVFSKSLNKKSQKIFKAGDIVVFRPPDAIIKPVDPIVLPYDVLEAFKRMDLKAVADILLK